MDTDEREFYRRRNLHDVEVRYLNAGRTQDVQLTHCGRDLGSKTTTIRRGKVVSTHYYLPTLPKDLFW